MEGTKEIIARSRYAEHLAETNAAPAPGTSTSTSTSTSTGNKRREESMYNAGVQSNPRIRPVTGGSFHPVVVVPAVVVLWERCCQEFAFQRVRIFRDIFLPGFNTITRYGNRMESYNNINNNNNDNNNSASTFLSCLGPSGLVSRFSRSSYHDVDCSPATISGDNFPL
ncbi:hypothetical protein KQX54_007294 [Cotesia glomerata]|uniref:Uncharacterized protein n=1 Tax=Cotesia glomerata TaxID=32391 RepID=A0AAV7HWR6_COTGL|nr:hypothetical protein KQX54_007294 [Cotesia glomerata]